MDSQMTGFWTESIKKEEALRLAWQLKYSKNFAKQVATKNKTLEEEALKVTAKNLVTDPLANIQRHIDRMEKELRKEKFGASAEEPNPEKSAEEAAKREEQRKKEEDDILNFREMRSPSPKTRMQLYEGISHHQEGRYAYLKKRKKKSPEEKYVFPVVSSTVYGWKIYDHMMPKSEYARNRIIRDTFYRHSGIITG